jgi:hypothetical protein
MTEGQFWLAIIAGIGIPSAVCAKAFPTRPVLAALVIPAAASVIVTIYVLLIEREKDPQVPIFLGFFYIVTVLIGIAAARVARLFP